MAPTWKHSFKAHRVAANIGNLDDNFIYHREAQSFPSPMSRTKPVETSAFSKKIQQVKSNLLPGGNRGMPGIMFGMALPVLGMLVIASFVSQSNSSNPFKQEMPSESPAESRASV